MKRRSPLMCMTVALLAATAAPRSAQAQTKPAAAAGPAESAEADARFRKGNELYKQQRFADAEAELEAAFRLKRAHDIAANLAYAEMRQGKMREAAEHLDFAVRNWAPTANEEKRRYAEARLATVKKEVATLRITVSVAGATVLIDGKEVGTSPLDGEVFVDPGTRTIEARRAGYEDAKQAVAATKGGQAAVTLSLEKAQAATADGGAAGAPVGPGGDSASSAGPADRTPERSEPGAGSSDARSSTTEAGPRTAVLIGGGVVAGAALIAGVVLTAVANSKAGERDALGNWEGCYESGSPAGLPDCTQVDALRRDAAGLGSAAFWSFVGAGVVGGATVAYALLAPRGESSAGGVGLVPVVAWGGGGLGVSGSF